MSLSNPLFLLVDFKRQGRLQEVVEVEAPDDEDGRSSQIVFGDGGLAWPSDISTCFVQWSFDDGQSGNRQFYSLGTLWFYAHHDQAAWADYLRSALDAKKQTILLSDKGVWNDLLNDTLPTNHPSIDRNAPVPPPVTPYPRRVAKVDGEASSGGVAGVGDSASTADAKRDGGGVQAAGDATAGITIDAMFSKERLEALREAAKTNKLKRPSAAGGSGGASSLLASKRKRALEDGIGLLFGETSITGDVPDEVRAAPAVARPAKELNPQLYERRCRTRLSILSMGTIAGGGQTLRDACVSALKQYMAAKSSAAMGDVKSIKPATTAMQAPVQQHHQHATSGYSRYDQEQYRNPTAALGFRLDMTNTYVPGVQPAPRALPGPHGSRKPMSNGGGAMINSGPAAHGISPNQQASSKKSRTPIIVVPSAVSSLITLYNAKDLLEELRFIPSDERKREMTAKGKHKEQSILVHRKKRVATQQPAVDGATVETVHYRVIDSVQMLTPDDWDRVVAVFVAGPQWQFKEWPWRGQPTEIFAHVKAFHVKWVGLETDRNVKNWNVSVIQLDRYKRHLDRGALGEFWTAMDKYLPRHKAHLRY